jgi:hypothetical protein
LHSCRWLCDDVVNTRLFLFFNNIMLLLCYFFNCMLLYYYFIHLFYMITSMEVCYRHMLWLYIYIIYYCILLLLLHVVITCYY